MPSSHLTEATTQGCVMSALLGAKKMHDGENKRTGVNEPLMVDECETSVFGSNNEGSGMDDCG
ncbi:hypothetical protein A2U01_0047984 [Trifolium medium]|uniref:Uncharacterized protein n=1 Tax=Trifolium medium TaxID=97028 RepID=A0A392QS13_9FABA|nr:hypothetical protein [Trifolium medium]